MEGCQLEEAARRATRNGVESEKTPAPFVYP